MAKRRDKEPIEAPASAAKLPQTHDPDDAQPSAELARLEEYLEELPEEQAQEYREIAVERFFSGPLPPPALYSSYDRVLPGAAERIMAMTEKEQAHRHQWENTALRGELDYGRLGLWLGTLALIAVIAGVVACAYLGQTWAAGALGAIGLTGIVTALIKGRTFSHNDKEGDA